LKNPVLNNVFFNSNRFYSFYQYLSGNQPVKNPIHKAAWFIILMTIIAAVLIVLLIFVLYTRHQGAKYLGKLK